MQTVFGTSRRGMKWSPAGGDEDRWPTIKFGAIGDAWRMYRRHWGTWSLTMLAAMVCTAVGEGLAAVVLKIGSAGMFGGLLGGGPENFSLLHVAVGSMIGGFFLGGMVRMALAQMRGKPPHVRDLFEAGNEWFDVVLGSALLGLLVSIGWHLLVVPGLVVAGIFLFMYPLIIDSRLPATGAMIQSFHVTRSQWLQATLVHVAIAAVAGLGTLLGGIGILVTGPLYALSLAILYRDIFLNPAAPAWEKPATPFGDF